MTDPATEVEPERSRPSLVSPPAVQEPRWIRCTDEFVGSIREFPMEVDGEQTTLGAQLDAGAVGRAVERLDDSFTQGDWMCFEGGATQDFEYRAALDGVDFGPRWTLRDARTVEPINLLAEAVHGTWEVTPGTEEAVRHSVLQCRVGTNWLTSGAYVHIASAPGSGTANPRWTVLPDVRVRRDSTYRATLSWRSAGEQTTAEWRVIPGTALCEPLNQAARRVTEVTEAIPRHQVRLATGSVRATNTPFNAHSARGRATAYVFAEERELRTIADFLKFRERQVPFDLGEWEVSGSGDDAGARSISLRVGGDAPFGVSYSVDPERGTTTPATEETILARAVLPLRAPGVGDIGDVPTRLEQDVIDSHVTRVSGELGACIPRGDDSLTVRWSIAWDGHTFDVESEPSGRVVADCVQDVVGELTFPRFLGSPVDTSFIVSVARD